MCYLRILDGNWEQQLLQTSFVKRHKEANAQAYDASQINGDDKPVPVKDICIIHSPEVFFKNDNSKQR